MESAAAQICWGSTFLNHLKKSPAQEQLSGRFYEPLRDLIKEVSVFGKDSGRLLIKLLQPLPAEVNVKHFITGLGSLGMAPGPGAVCLARSQRSRATQVLVHQGKSSTGNERKADQVDSSQKVVQGSKLLSITLL